MHIIMRLGSMKPPCDIMKYWLDGLIWLIYLIGSVTSGVVDRDPLPQFTDTPTNVTTFKGSEAILRCGVENLGTKTVGWRKLPYNVPITVGKDQFLELERFKLYRIPYKEEWNLHIKNAQTHDSGVYECQVSSKAQKIRRNVTLTVFDKPVEPKSKPGIQLTGTQYVEKGDSIHLVCNVTGQDDPPQSIDWFKDGRRLESNYNKKVYIQQHVSISEKTIKSAVDINHAQLEDTGFYVCKASKLHQRIKVDVLNAETSNKRRETPSGGAYSYPSSDSNSLLFSKPVTLLTLISSIVITYSMVRLTSCQDSYGSSCSLS